MLRKILLATLLLAFFVVAPALAAPDTTYYTNPVNLLDDSGLKIYLVEVIASDTSLGSYGGAYSSPDYRYYVLYYRTENPTDSAIRWQYDIRFVDNNGVEYKSADEIIGSTIAAGFRSTESQPVEYVIPKNATGLYLRWYHIDKYLNEKVWEKIMLEALPVTTPTPTPAPTATGTPTPAASPTATAKPTPADGFLPVLAIGLVASGFLLARARK
jgi:hypothetical protein